jgi:hypothetical protein
MATNSTKQSTIVVGDDDNKEYTIRVCGTASDPYFLEKTYVYKGR